MKEIILSAGKVALVDDDDYETVSEHKWSYHPSRKEEKMSSAKYYVKEVKISFLKKELRLIKLVDNPNLMSNNQCELVLKSGTILEIQDNGNLRLIR